jgi:hypothetical protein
VPRSAAPPAEETPLDEKSKLVLQAVTQLLLEKGVLGKSELFERVRELRDALDAGD